MLDMKKTYVIIGGGVAAVGCAEGIRTTDKSSRVVIIADEGHAPYFRPLISYYLEGKTDLDRMRYRPEGFYSENGIEFINGKASDIDVKAHTPRGRPRSYLRWRGLTRSRKNSAL